jgi:glutathione S-transferase
MNRLITIPISHYCDKARWALERCDVKYREEPHLQGFSWFAGKAAGGSRYLPVLVTDDGIWSDSTDIVAWADGGRGILVPVDPTQREQALSFEDRFDEVLGWHSRSWFYYRVFQNIPLILRYGSYSVPRFQARVLPIVRPLIVAMIRSRFDIDEASHRKSLHVVENVFADVAKRLADGRRFLMGDEFTVADLTFASMASPMLMPENYGIPVPPPGEYDDETASVMYRLRDTVAGTFAMRLYAEERTNG